MSQLNLLTQFARNLAPFSATSLIVMTSLWITLVANWATLLSFARAKEAGAGVQFAWFVGSGFSLTFTVVFALLALGSALFVGRAVKIWLMFALIVSALLGFYSLFFGAQFDRTMLVNMLQTHPSEAMELAGVRMISWVLVVGVLPCVAVALVRLGTGPGWWRVALARSTIVLCMGLATLALILPNYQAFASAARNRAFTFHTIAPANLITAAMSYWYAHRMASVVRQSKGEDAVTEYPLPKPRVLVMLMGETARAQNYAANGYERDTNPQMVAQKALYFASTESCGTATAFSVPCIFSGLKRADFSLIKARGQETLIDVLHHAGTEVWWRDNDSGCKDVCAKAIFEDFTGSANARWCPEPGSCFDEILLEGLEQRISQITKDTLIVLHLKGSHGPAYFKRYPKAFEKFVPACQSNELSACEVQTIRNAYDNTILYTDHIIGQTIEMLKRQSKTAATALLYVSDHGESLGEKGLFLHGFPYAVAPLEQTRVPMAIWLSPHFVALERWSARCIQDQVKRQRSHDNVYHTILGILDVKTAEYDKTRDIFSPCD